MSTTDNEVAATQPAPDFTIAQRLYVWLAALSVTCLLIADLIGIRLFKIGVVEHTCGMLTFPLTFLLTDLINEYYGKKGARRVTYIAFTMAIFVFIVINISQTMPRLEADFNVNEDAYNAVFGSAKIMYIASLCAYLVGQLSDIALFGMIKRLTSGKLIWLRATGSTVVSQMLDSFVVSYLAFGLGPSLFPQPGKTAAAFSDVLHIAATGYTLKFIIAIAVTPFIYMSHAAMRKWFGLIPAPVEGRA